MSSHTTTSSRPSAKIIAASTAGTIVEWYDFFIYTTAATLVFGTVFFPKSESDLTGIIAAFGTYAVGFFARPVGGVVFGHFGDKIGRKRLLQISLLIIGLATMGIGLLPTFGQVGWLAPILLVTMRFLQGFAVGGEWGGAVLLIAEHGGADRRGFWASFPQASVPAGNILATAMLALLTATMPEEAFLSWGWRVAFLASAVLVLLGYYIRTQIEDAPVFKEAMAKAAAEEREHSPLKEVLRDHKGTLGRAMGVRVIENIFYYMVVAFSITYLKVHVGTDTTQILNLMLLATFVHLVAVPFCGYLSDRIGRRPVIGIGYVLTAVWALTAFPVFDLNRTGTTFGMIVLGLVAHAFMYGPQAAYFSEMFPTRMRYTGISVASQVTAMFAGGLAPIIATALLAASGHSMPVTIYLLAATAISVFALAISRETRGVEYHSIDKAVSTASIEP